MIKPSRWVNNVNAIFWMRVVRSTSLDVRSLCVLRIFTGFFLLAFYFPTFSWIAKTPRALFKPSILSLANLVRTFPGEAFFIGIDLLLILSIVCIIIGFKARMASIFYVLLSFTGLSFKYAYGKIDHDILPYILLGCMAFSGWGSYLAVRPDKAVAKATTDRCVSLTAVLICFAFFTAGFEKALNWLDFNSNTSGFAAWLYNGYYGLDRKFLLAPYFNNIPFKWLEILDYTAIAFELSPIIFLLHSRKAWRSWLLIACVFHLVNTLFLNIPFIANVVVYLAFYDHSTLFERVRHLSGKKSYQVLFTSLIALLVLIRLRTIFSFEAASNIFAADYLTAPNLYIGLVIWILVLVLISNSILKENLAVRRYKPATLTKVTHS